MGTSACCYSVFLFLIFFKNGNKNKKNIATRNKINIFRRYAIFPTDYLSVEIGGGENESEVRPILQDTDIPSTSFSTNLPEVTNDGKEVSTSRPSEKFEKATGFTL